LPPSLPVSLAIFPAHHPIVSEVGEWVRERCLAFTSSTAPRVTVMTSDQASLLTVTSD
ncbi:unnamed protein product, partial [Scytosiphon promiscuus]